mmetsp:Transcript_75312/g.197401  ORF Transcript_75312/g.197401 Transcript_75312/m.197401 type:complete len:218 (+) Transcript_75312:408-1061(+)
MHQDGALDVLGGDAELVLDLGADNGLGGDGHRLHVVGVPVRHGVEVRHQPVQLLLHEVVDVNDLLDADPLDLVRGAGARVRRAHDLRDGLSDGGVALVLVQEGVEIHHRQAVLLQRVARLDLPHPLVRLVELEGLGQELLRELLHVALHLVLGLDDLLKDLLHLLLRDLVHVLLLLLLLDAVASDSLLVVLEQVVQHGASGHGTGGSDEQLLRVHWP